VKSDSPNITALLQRFGVGDAQAADELIPLLYNDLRRMASLPAAGKRVLNVAGY
jgi:hypothetical protein